MGTFITAAIIGILIIVLGAINMTGNINSLHWYHRQRVTKEDVKPFGRAVGSGTVLCGAACVFFSVMFFAYELTSLVPLIWVGIVGLLLCMAIGLFISIKAIIKYNKGLF